MISYELTKWAGYEKEEWNRENLRLRDDSNASIRNFWTKSGLNQTKEYYPDSAGEQWCTVWCKTFKRAQDLKSHKTRMKHHERKQPVRTNTTVWLEKRKKIQDDLPKVVWKRYTKTVALDRGQLITVQVPRIYIRGGRWTHDGCVHENCDGQNQVWKTVTPVEWQVSTPESTSQALQVLCMQHSDLRIRDMVHGRWNKEGTMVSVLTGKTQHQEASSPKWRIFDLVVWVRSRRLQWLVHILRMESDRKLKQAVFEMFKCRKTGDTFMDAPDHASWREICTHAMDKNRWRVMR